MARLDACTIVSKNYLPFARVLARSFLRHQPDGHFHVLLVDRVDGYFSPPDEPFEIVEVEQLPNLAQPLSLLFKYTILEANTAVKPFFLEYLLEREEVERLVYFDPDIEVLAPLDHLQDVLATSDIALTPHLTAAIDDEYGPGELEVLRSGAYNLGFLALAKRGSVRQLLRWWQERVKDRCVVQVEEGLFVDQKWIDLVPGMYDAVAIIRHPGYNVAYWNLHCRTVEVGEAATANGEPLYFFHYSGIDIDDLESVSRHQNRFSLRDIGQARKLLEGYREQLLDAGLTSTRSWPYAYACFDNGVVIPELARRLYRSLGKGCSQFGNPFATTGANSFWSWINAPAHRASSPFVSRLLLYLWRSEAALQASFPDPYKNDLLRFSEWVEVYGKLTYRLDPQLLGGLMHDDGAISFVPRLVKGCKRQLKRWYESPLARRAKEWTKRRLGEQLVLAIKRRTKPLASGHRYLTPSSQELQPTIDLSRVGVNLIGYLQAESGMGECARSLAGALQAAGIPVSLETLDLNVLSRREDLRFSVSSSHADLAINLVAVNADQVGPVTEYLGCSRFDGHYNVGFWLWEQEELPARWLSSFTRFDEIWTPSRFCLDAISGLAPIPVRRVPLPVIASATTAAQRRSFDLPEDRFLFLFVFDFLSYVERKNPLELVRAFHSAFAGDTRALLVLKTTNAEHNPEVRAQLERATDNDAMLLIDEYLSRQQVYDLMAVCDCYVSLHRSEGFGLTMAEAMALGKPVIATHYSGNTDFMNPANSLPVGFRLVTLDEDAGPYPKGSCWAAPDGEQAATLMRLVVDQPALARRLGERAREDIHALLSTEAVAAVVRRRLADIVRRKGGGVGLTHPAAE